MLDGHSTHTKSIELIDKARNAGVILLCFPPHCTHKLQPLDVDFMKPLSLYYSDEVKRWLREHANEHRVVTQFQVASLFGKAYLKAASMTLLARVYPLLNVSGNPLKFSIFYFV